MTTAGGFSRANTAVPTQQPAVITSLDLPNRIAYALPRYPGAQALAVDLSHQIGAMQIIPSIGETWYIQLLNGQYRLASKVATQTLGVVAPEMNLPPVAGQTMVSAQGPLELNAAQINAHAPLSVHAVTTTARPAASSVPAGTHIYDTTLGKPIWSNGTNWTDATGATV